MPAHPGSTSRPRSDPARPGAAGRIVLALVALAAAAIALAGCGGRASSRAASGTAGPPGAVPPGDRAAVAAADPRSAAETGATPTSTDEEGPVRPPEPRRDESRLPPVPAFLRDASTLDDLRERVTAAVLADGIVTAEQLRISFVAPPREFRLPARWRALEIDSASTDSVGLVSAQRALWRGLLAAGAIKDTNYLLGLRPVGAMIQQALTPEGLAFRASTRLARWPVELSTNGPPIRRPSRARLRRAYLAAAHRIHARATVRTIETLGIAIEIDLVVNNPRAWICGTAGLPVRLDPYGLRQGAYDGRFLVVRDRRGRLVLLSWYAARIAEGAGSTGPAYLALAASCGSSNAPPPPPPPTGP